MSKGIKQPWKDGYKVAVDFIKRFTTGTVEIAGSIRREIPLVGDIDLITDESLTTIKERLLDQDEQILRSGKEKLDLLYKGFQINVRHAEPEYWGAMLMRSTGPRQYNIAYSARAKKFGLLLNEYGLWKGKKRIAGDTEESIYHALDKEYKEPKLRGK